MVNQRQKKKKKQQQKNDSTQHQKSRSVKETMKKYWKLGIFTTTLYL